MPLPPRLAVGCMTGTSIDAIDAALVRVEGAGLAMRAGFIRAVSRPLGDLAAPLRALAAQEPRSTGDIARLARAFSLAHAEAVRELLAPGAEEPALICVHGQTVFHRPPESWQLFNPWPLARARRVPVVFDLRGADLAHGGQGAPITPLADWVFFRGARATAVVNLGGFCNATILPPRDDRTDPAAQVARIEGFDICACNLLLDDIARRLLGVPYDEGGRTALAGTVQEEPCENLVGVLVSGSRSGRSLGTGDEAFGWVSRWRARAPPSDLAATACAAIARVVAPRLAGAESVLIAGGGARNGALVRALERSVAAGVRTLDAVGVLPIFREAAEFAVLGALCQDRVPISLPRVTGVADPAPIAGCWAVP